MLKPEFEPRFQSKTRDHTHCLLTQQETVCSISFIRSVYIYGMLIRRMVPNFFFELIILFNWLMFLFLYCDFPKSYLILSVLSVRLAYSIF